MRKLGIPEDRILTMRWVLTWKIIDDPDNPRKAKARLIIRGFQDPDLMFLQRDSPTLPVCSRNILLSEAARRKWHVEKSDIKTAFLREDMTQEKRQIYASPPSEVREILDMKDDEVFSGIKSCLRFVE